MTLIGLTDSIEFDLITVNCFDSLNNTCDMHTEIKSCNSSECLSGNAETKCQDKVTKDRFKTAIIEVYKELFFRIGKLEGEINITFMPNMVPYVVLVCRVAHSLQEPLKQELDKLTKPGIIVLLGIGEP